MRILWVVNIMLPDIANALNRETTNREGWLTGILHRMQGDTDELQLSIAYPVMDTSIKECTILNGIKCYPFYEDLKNPQFYDSRTEHLASTIINKVNPDIVHIYGTEFPHALAFGKAFNNPGKTIVTIQGICSLIAKDYMAMLPKKVTRSATFRDIVRRDSIYLQLLKFKLRAVSENQLLSLTENVIGRTFFDKRYVFKINPSVRYFKVNETMRDSFYEGEWKKENARPHTLFLSQGDYPIKGLHFLIEAAGRLVDKYSDLEIKIAGNSIINNASFKDKLKAPAYGKYLNKLIVENRLDGHIRILGSISEERMKEEYLSCSAFICASYVENSPNTLAEAMLLGVPVITSDAGGITDMISYNEGYIFSRGNVDELAECIDRVFVLEDKNSPELIKNCTNSIKRAKEEFDGLKNYESLMAAYKKVVSE